MVMKTYNEFTKNSEKKLQNITLKLSYINKGIFNYIGEYEGKKVLVEAGENNISSIDFGLEESLINLISSDYCIVSIDNEMIFKND